MTDGWAGGVNQTRLLEYFENPKWDWREGLAVKNIYCFFTDPNSAFNTQVKAAHDT